MLDDGCLELKVVERYDKDNLLTEVVVGGYILSFTCVTYILKILINVN